MYIYKAYKFRLYPTMEQQILINKTLGCNRFVYNYYLSKKQEQYKLTKKSMTCFETIRDLTNLNKEYEWLKEIDSMSLRCSLFDLDNAYTKMYKEHSGYPKYKSKTNIKNSYRTNYIKSHYKNKIYENIKVNLKNETITLPKLKEIKIRGYRHLDKLNGRIINATVSKDLTNKYYVSVLVEEINQNKEKPSRSIVGIDLGIKDVIIQSDSKKYANQKLLEKYEKRIKKYQKDLSRKIKKSNNYNKAKEKLARAYQKLTNARKYLIHQITNNIIKSYDIIISEKLQIKNMMQNHKLAKKISDVSWNEITRQLEYKTKWYYKKYYQIDTYYPSSQMCSVCGNKESKVKDLKIRKWKCKNCGSEHDRDINAAENILFEGIKQYMKEIKI